jgi:hypothetical protein
MISGIVCNSYYKTFVTQLCNVDQIVHAKYQLIPEIPLRRNGIQTWYLQQLKATANLNFQILFLHVV